jgi:hypothetical protein
VLFLAAAIASGCAGRGEASYSLSDARHLANMRPVAAPWTWRPEDKKSADSGAAPRHDPVLARFHRQTKGLVDLGDAAGEWTDADKLAHIDVAVYRSAAEAHKAFAPFNALSLGWARNVLGHSSVEGLGDEAWLLRVADDGQQVTYHWRRDNVLVEAHMHCFGACPPGLVAAARAWAERIDAAAGRLDGD